VTPLTALKKGEKDLKNEKKDKRTVFICPMFTQAVVVARILDMLP
jgi:hypothetical protein